MKFAQKPHFIQHQFILGAGAATRARGAKKATLEFVREGEWLPPIIHGRHPETWATMPEAFRAQYDVKTEEDLSAEMNASMTASRERMKAA